MVECYSVFCQRQTEAISFYKEQLQNNKKLQILMRVRGCLFVLLLQGERTVSEWIHALVSSRKAQLLSQTLIDKINLKLVCDVKPRTIFIYFC